MPEIPQFTVWCPVVPEIHYNTMSEARDDALNMSNPDARRLAALKYVKDRIRRCPPWSGVFDAMVLPLLAFYLHPSKCPSIADSPSLWDDQLDFIWSCLLLLRESVMGSNTDKMIVEDALSKWWPGLAKWMLYFFQRAIEDGNILEGKWRDVLLTTLWFSSLPEVNSDPRIADATWHRSADVGFAFVQLSHSLTAYVLAKYSAEPPEDGYDAIALTISHMIAHEVIANAATTQRPGTTSRIVVSLSSPSLGAGAIVSLITTISIRPLPFTVLDALLASVNDAASMVGNRFWLAAQRAVYWNVMALRAIVKHKPDSQMTPLTRELMNRSAETAIMYIYFALSYMSRDIIPDLARLGIFHIIAQLAPLVDRPPSIFDGADLKSAIQKLLHRLALFGGWKCIARAVGPHIEALRVYESGGDLVEGSPKPQGSFIDIFSELYEASITYGYRSRRICWSSNCPAATPKRYGQEDEPLCRACSRCQAVAYCSSECQRADWNSGHKEECQRVCEEERLYQDERRPGRESTMMTQRPPILLKQQTFMYHYGERILSRNLNLIYTHFVDPTTRAYINVDDSICVTFFANPAVRFENGSLQDGSLGCKVSETLRLVQIGVPWNMTTDGFNRPEGSPDMQVLLGTVELPAQGHVFEKDSVLKLEPTFSQLSWCPLGGWCITGGVQ